MLQMHPAEVHINDPPRFYGTPLFASIASLRGGLPCPADDVEALLYSLLSMGAPPDYGGRAALPFEVSRFCASWLLACSLPCIADNGEVLLHLLLSMGVPPDCGSPGALTA